MSERAGINTNTDLPEFAPLCDYQIPADPLLESGTFIYMNDDLHTDQNGVVYQSESSRTEPSASGSNGGSVSQEKTTATPLASTTADGTPNRTRPGGALEDVKRPEWLPEGWQMELRVRSSGQTAGTIDRYYVEPVAGRKFRSKKEVFHFLETGTVRKRKNNPEADVMPSEGSEDHREKKSGSKTKKPSSFYFDFKNVPHKVSWVLTNASKEIWTPVVGDEAVPESTQWEWAAVFSHVSSQLKKSAPPN